MHPAVGERAETRLELTTIWEPGRVTRPGVTWVKEGRSRQGPEETGLDEGSNEESWFSPTETRDGWTGPHPRRETSIVRPKIHT